MKSNDHPGDLGPAETTLKILMLTTSYPATADDPSGFFVHQLAEALAARNLAMTVLTPSGNRPAGPLPGAVPVRRFRYAPLSWQRLAQLPGGIPAALKADRKNLLLVPPFLLALSAGIVSLARSADVILANWAISGALAAWLAPLHRRPIATILRGSDVNQGSDHLPLSPLLAAALKGSRAVITVSTEMAERLRQNPARAAKIHHVPNGVHPAFLDLAPPTPGPILRLLYVGNLIPNKGVELLIRATAALSRLPLRTTIVGDGPQARELQNLSVSLGLADRVFFTGQVPPGNGVARMMAEADLLVLPSEHEGRPNVVVEALAAGRPVVGTDIPSLRELLKPSEAGRLFPVGDVDGLTHALAALASDPEERLRLGRNGREWILAGDLTWHRAAEHYHRILTAVTVARTT